MDGKGRRRLATAFGLGLFAGLTLRVPEAAPSGEFPRLAAPDLFRPGRRAPPSPRPTPSETARPAPPRPEPEGPPESSPVGRIFALPRIEAAAPAPPPDAGTHAFAAAPVERTLRDAPARNPAAGTKPRPPASADPARRNSKGATTDFTRPARGPLSPGPMPSREGGPFSRGTTPLSARAAAIREALGRVDFDGRVRHPHALRHGGEARAARPGPDLGKTPRGKKSDDSPSRRFRPPTLQDWLGPGALRPPEGKLRPPAFPARKAPDPPPSAAQVESLKPPDLDPNWAAWTGEDGGAKRAAHWHRGQDATAYYHDGPDWGRDIAGSWAWQRQYYRLWWTKAEGGTPLVFHSGHWWFRESGVWFLLHEGQPWAWRYFADWEREGFIHPGTGTRIVYSADGGRVAVETPGAGAAVFDARTGEELAAFP